MKKQIDIFSQEFESYGEAMDYSKKYLHPLNRITTIKRIGLKWVLEMRVSQSDKDYKKIFDAFYNAACHEVEEEEVDLDLYLDNCKFYETYSDGGDDYLGDGMYRSSNDLRNDWNR